MVSNYKARPGLELQSQKIRLLLEPNVDKKVRISLREKNYSTFFPKDEGIVVRVNIEL